MKIIDLLNKIANGEEVPKKFIIKGSCFKDLYYEYNEKYDCYDLIGKNFKYGCYVFGYGELNEEVEIIEEDKKDEEIELYFNGKKVDITDIFEPLKQGEYIYKENDKWYAHRLKNVTFEVEEDKKIENIKVKSTFTRNQKQIARKINEIIDYINKGDK
jgi:hypothetical protein